MKKIFALFIVSLLLLSPVLARAEDPVFFGQVIASTTEQASSTMVLGAGTSPLTGQGFWTNPFHDSLFDGIAGSATFKLTEDTDIEGGGGLFGARINGSSTAVFTSQTAGVYGSLSGVKAMPGATGHAVQINGVLAPITNASPTFIMNKVTDYTAGNVQGPGGNVENLTGFLCKNKMNYGTISNTCLSIMTDEPVAGNWAIYDASGYKSLLSNTLTVNGGIISTTAATSTDNDWVRGAPNAGFSLIANGNSAGTNLGSMSVAKNASVNIGFGAVARIPKANAVNVGSASLGFNNASGGIQVGGYAGIRETTPIFNTSAAFIADNGSSTTPVILGYDNGSEVFRVDHGGDMTIKNGKLCLDNECITKGQLHDLLQLLE